MGNGRKMREETKKTHQNLQSPRETFNPQGVNYSQNHKINFQQLSPQQNSPISKKATLLRVNMNASQREELKTEGLSLGSQRDLTRDPLAGHGTPFLGPILFPNPTPINFRIPKDMGIVWETYPLIGHGS